MGKIELFQLIHHPQALLRMTKTPGHDFVQHRFTRMAERRVPEVMAEADSLSQILIKEE
jgi:hypothetical protein